MVKVKPDTHMHLAQRFLYPDATRAPDDPMLTENLRHPTFGNTVCPCQFIDLHPVSVVLTEIVITVRVLHVVVQPQNVDETGAVRFFDCAKTVRPACPNCPKGDVMSGVVL